MNTSHPQRRKRLLAVGLSASMMLISMPGTGRADFLPVHSGPEAVSTTPWGTAVNVNGAASGNNGVESCYEFGCAFVSRGFRWSSAGTSMLSGLDPFTFGYYSSRAYAINDAGTVVGSTIRYDDYGSQNGERAVRWSAGSSVATELPNLGASSEWFTSRAFAINADGVAVGEASKYSGEEYGGERGVRWDSTGNAVSELGHLGAPEGFTRAAAIAINASGAAVGSAYKYDDANTLLGGRAVRWDASTTAATELTYPTLISGSLNSQATAINDLGTVVGHGQLHNASGVYIGGAAVLWDTSGTPTLLNAPPPSQGDFTQSLAHSINHAGTTIGAVQEYDYTGDDGVTIPVLLGSRAVRWDGTSTAATVLGTLGENPNGFTDSSAYSINSAGFAVGYATTYEPGPTAGTRAVYWGSDGVAVDLNTLIDPNSGWLLTHAFAISDTGWITGVGELDSDGPGGQEASSRHYLIQVASTSRTLSGDFNGDGAVNAADYVSWRKGLTSNGPVDYDTWRANFGRMLSGSSQALFETSHAAVPEPSLAVQLLAAAIFYLSPLGIRSQRSSEYPGP